MNLLNIKYQSKTSQDISVNILQADGKTIMTKRARVNVGTNNIQIETTDINPGAYIVKIVSQNSSEAAQRIYKK
jgi:hypothetical protein